MGYAYMGSGKSGSPRTARATLTSSARFVDVENASIFEITLQPDEKELMDFTNPAGGTDASVKRIKTVTGKWTCATSRRRTWRAPWGTTTAQTATPITGEAGYKINAGGFIATKRLIDITVAPCAEKGGTAILSADFTYSAGGVQIASTITTPAVTSGDAITIDYTPLLSTSAQGAAGGCAAGADSFRGHRREFWANNWRRRSWQAVGQRAVAVSDRGRIRSTVFAVHGAQRFDDFSGDQLRNSAKSRSHPDGADESVHLGRAWSRSDRWELTFADGATGCGGAEILVPRCDSRAGFSEDFGIDDRRKCQTRRPKKWRLARRPNSPLIEACKALNRIFPHAGGNTPRPARATLANAAQQT